MYFLGTLVMKVIATDADKPGTSFSSISYSIARQSNSAGMFYINSQTGEVFVQQNTLDREVGCPTNLKFLSCSCSPYHTITLNRFAFSRLFFFFSVNRPHHTSQLYLSDWCSDCFQCPSKNTHRANISLNIKTGLHKTNHKRLLMHCVFFCFGFQTHDTYKLIIKAADFNGRPGGNTGTGEIEIKLLDINDNIPTLERDSVGFTHTHRTTVASVLF